MGALLTKQHDEWQAGRRYFSAESLATLTRPAEQDESAPALLAAG